MGESGASCAAYPSPVLNRELVRYAPPRSDVVLAFVLLAFVQLEIWTVADINRPAAALFLGASSLTLAWRRRAPVAVVVLSMSLEAGAMAFGVPVDLLNSILPRWAISLYSLGAYADIRAAIGGLIAAVGIVLFGTLLAPRAPGPDNIVFGLIVTCGPWLTGRLVRRRTDHAVALALRAQELERSQAAREQAAVALERERIARELHDIIAHSVSVMTIQAGAVEEIIEQDPGKAKEAAAAIRSTGRQALVDLRRMLGLLRDEAGQSAALAPQPGLANLDQLLDDVRRAGLAVTLDVEGIPKDLPAAIDLSAFRVVQESLTNILKHARASAARVDVRYRSDAVDIEVVDDGAGEPPGLHDAPQQECVGHGLIGMRERVALYGGTLEYGRRAAGGFRVHALLPLEVEPR